MYPNEEQIEQRSKIVDEQLNILLDQQQRLKNNIILLEKEKDILNNLKEMRTCKKTL